MEIPQTQPPEIEARDPKEELKRNKILLKNMQFQLSIQEVIVKKLEELAR